MTSLPKYYITTQQEIDNMKSNSLIFINCEYCDTKFSIQKKKLTLQLKNQNTYRTTCTTSCFIKLNTIDLKVETNCKTCNKEIIKRKKEIEESKSGFVFCSSSCAATYNNKIYKVKNKQVITKIEKLKKETTKRNNCSQCNNEYTIHIINLDKHKTCSIKCWYEAEMKTKVIKNCLGKGTNKFSLIRKNARSYSKYIYPLKCMLCTFDKHYEVCHVKALTTFDNNETLFEVNNKANLVHLCPNCHWEFDHNLIPVETIIQAQNSSLIEKCDNSQLN